LVFLQETMAPTERSRNFFHKLKGDWVVASTNTEGQSVGFLSAWNPKNTKFIAALLYTGYSVNGLFIGICR
jgi:hypothetical protein